MKRKYIRRVKRIVTLLQLAATASLVAMTVYTLIPKDEKIKNINTASLEAYGTKKEEKDTQLQTEAE